MPKRLKFFIASLLVVSAMIVCLSFVVNLILCNSIQQPDAESIPAIEENSVVPSNFSNFTIMLDPGHGGSDPGAEAVISTDEQKYESHITLSIALKIKKILEANGITVLMTRTANTDVLLDERVSMLKSQKPDMFISVHVDASDFKSAIGTSAFYWNADSQTLASAIHEKIVSCYRTDIYKNASDSQKYNVDRFTQHAAYRVTKVTECPSVLIEYGFITNKKECRILQSSFEQEKLAQATVSGIMDYINSNLELH